MPHERFEELRERLLRAGIAPRHVRRYVSELRDHFDDLVREGTEKGLARKDAEEATGNRIGSDDALADVMLSRPDLRSITARFPWAVFGIGLVLMLLIMIVAAVLIEGIFLHSHRELVLWWEGELPATPPDWIKFLVFVWNGLVMYAAPLMIAALLCVLGTRQRSSRRWIMLGTAVVCILGAFHEVALTWSELPGRSVLEVSVAWEPPFPRHMLIAGLFRAVVNVAVVGVGYWLWVRRSSEAVAQ